MKKVEVIVDRALGSSHPKYSDLIYPINYGYVKDIMGGDGEEQDVYIVGVDTPIDHFFGEVIAIVHRSNDVEEKWVAAPEGQTYPLKEIEEMVSFQEQYFDSWIEVL